MKQLINQALPSNVSSVEKAKMQSQTINHRSGSIASTRVRTGSDDFIRTTDKLGVNSSAEYMTGEVKLGQYDQHVSNFQSSMDILSASKFSTREVASKKLAHITNHRGQSSERRSQDSIRSVNNGSMNILTRGDGDSLTVIQGSKNISVEPATEVVLTRRNVALTKKSRQSHLMRNV